MPTPLANQKLEALRRTAAFVQAFPAKRLPTEMLTQFVEAGWGVEGRLKLAALLNLQKPDELEGCTRSENLPSAAENPLGERLASSVGEAMPMLGRWAALLVVSNLLTSCGAADPDAFAEANALPVQVAPARSTQTGQVIDTTGIAAFEREASLSFRVAGTISQLPVRIGDTVAIGQTLARLNATDFAQALISREAELARAERTSRRLDALVNSGAVPAADALDQQDSVAQAKAAAASARYDRQSSMLISPFSGVVLERTAEIGQTVGPNNQVLRVADLRSAFLVRVTLTPTDAQRVAPGDRADVRFGAGAAVAGEVVRLQPLANAQTGTRMAEVQIYDLQAGTSGTVASVRVFTKEARQASGDVAIPAEGLVSLRDGRTGVFLVTPQRRASFVAARLIRFQDDMAIITGIREGTQVVTAGAGYLKHSDRVRITNGDGS